MKLGILANTLEAEASGQTTYRLAACAVNRGHDVWMMSPGNFSFDPDDRIRMLSRMIKPRSVNSSEDFLLQLKNKNVVNQWISTEDLDVLLLRNNPSVQSPWAQSAGIAFGRLAMRRGVIVLNDPNGLGKAMNKLYFQLFPEMVRPKTLITRNKKRIREFADEQGKIILKPLQGSGGKSVFVFKPPIQSNLDQIIDAISRDGYIIAQEYLPAATEGDMRFFLMNGLPLRYKGKYAAFRRIRSGDDIRSNIHAGGKLRQAIINETHLKLAEIVRPKLVQDGMFLVGLDIVGEKLMEINVFTPGGLGSAEMFEKVDFTLPVIEALERKVHYMRFYHRNFDNMELATL